MKFPKMLLIKLILNFGSINIKQKKLNLLVQMLELTSKIIQLNIKHLENS